MISTFTVKPPNADALADIDAEQQSIAQLKADLSGVDTGEINFAPGSTELTPSARETLSLVARSIQKYDDLVIEIAGHTDSRGDAFSNLELSKRRADSVRSYLIEQGIPSERLRAIGYGETKPLGENSTPEGRAANRRIEFNL